MNDMQIIMDAIGSASRIARQDYHLTLGQLIACLENAEPSCVVEFSHEMGFPGDEISYRGYYSDLAFEPSGETKTTGALLTQCRNALGKTYKGYKGGDFLMDADTPLWMAHCGNVGAAIMDCVPMAGKLVLTIKYLN